MILMAILFQLLIAIILAALIAVVAWRYRALSRSGALAATIVGGLVFGLGGPTWGVVMVAFFLSSSLFSFWQHDRKLSGSIEHAKHAQRDAVQVLANGGLGALLAVVVGIVGHESSWYPWLTLAYFGSLSAAAADTWATEIGMLSTQTPRLITTGQPVPRGQSGGVSWLGFAASLGGGLMMGVSTFLFIQLASLLTTGQWFLQDWFLLPVCAFAGLAGSVVDSLFGASLQHQYYCEQCQMVSERPIHSCGQPTRSWRGLSWMNNDVVNFLATMTGAIAAVILASPFLPA